MPIAESPSQMAQDMMARVREMVAQGKSRQEILDYFADRYGEWVLLEPTAHGMNLGLWVLPGVALLVGAALVLRYVRRQRGASIPLTPAEPPADAVLKAIRDEVHE